jgi:hypothetical protein
LAAAENVLEQAVEAGCKKIIHVSSITAIYNSKAKKLDHKSPLGVAKNAYGRSKVQCEKYARSLQEKGAPLHITWKALYATLKRLTGRNILMLPVPGISMRLLGRTLDLLKPLAGTRELHYPCTGRVVVPSQR